MKIVDHKLQRATWCPSPNFNERPELKGDPINMLVVHNISLPPNEFGGGYIEDFFSNALDCSVHPYFETIKDLQVSSHLLIKRDGDVVQFVPFNKRAWHAGQSEFKGEKNCNDFSIGIELEGADHIAYEAVQYKILAEVSHTLMQAYPDIVPERLVGHCNIAPSRKTDPGESFDWDYFRSCLLAVK